MWIVCITSVRHVLTVNGYGGRQTKENEKSWCFKGWETLVNEFIIEDITELLKYSEKSIKEIANYLEFPNLSYFGKYVKAHTGMSPTQYRKHLINKL